MATTGKLFFFTSLVTALCVQSSHVFDDLSASELQEVIDYLMMQPDLALKDQSKAGLSSSFIRMVESMGVEKAAALRYLDQGGRKPTRRATAIIYRGDLPTPIVQEYVIWPIPSPKQHKLIENSKWRNPIPFNARSPLNSIELDLQPKRMAREFAKIDHILEMTTGGFKFNNCSSQCLEIAPGGPAQVEAGKHLFLGYLIRTLEGKFLHPVGLQYVLDMEDRNSDKWKVLSVWWQSQKFSSFDDLHDKFATGTLTYKNLGKPQGLFTEDMASSLNHRGSPLPEAAQRGPRSYMPDGDRFNEESREVAWQGWSFNFNVRSSTGIQLHDIRFQKERIVYELSLQELAVFYSGWDPMSRHTAFYDSDAMLGYSGTELFKGVDCPSNARFYDTIHFHNGKPLKFPNTICLFEWDRGIPLRRHYASNYNGGYKYFQGMPDNVLILRTIPTIDNYDYIVDVMFHQDGKIEVKTSLTGYLVTSFFDKDNAQSYGYEVLPDVIGNLHLHSANFRVDMDIAGTKNRMSTLDLSLEDVQDDLNSNTVLKNRKFTRNVKKTEKEAAYKFDFDTPKYIVFSNVNSTNQFQNERGYRLHVADGAKMLLPDDYRGNKAWAFTKYQMAVTVYDEEELRSSSLYNYMEPFHPIFSLDDYIGEDDIVDKDLVAWVTLGCHHIPHTEDVPIVTTPSLQLTFYLLPYNFFNEDPSLASRDNVKIKPGPSGDYIVTHAGVPAEEYCAQKDVTCHGVIGKPNGSSSMFRSASSLMMAILILVVVVL